MPYFNPTEMVILLLVGVGLIALYVALRARKSSAMPAEKKERLLKYGLLAGAVLIGLGVFLYAWELVSPLTAEKIVQIERKKATLPMDIDAITTWESIEAGPQRVIYTYTVHRAPRDRDALATALRLQITQSVCADKLYREAVNQNIIFEFIYKFADPADPLITLSPGPCEN